MKRPFLLLITAFLVISTVRAQGTWVNYKIDNKVSIKLPTKPKTFNENSVYALDKDSLVYIVAAVDFQKAAGLDSAALASLSATPEFADKIEKGLEKKMPGFTMSDIKISKWKDNYTCYKIEGNNDTTNVNSYAFMVIIGSKIYALITLIPDNRTGIGKNAFYASLAVN